MADMLLLQIPALRLALAAGRSNAHDSGLAADDRPVGNPVALFAIPFFAVASLIAATYPYVLLALKTF